MTATRIKGIKESATFRISNIASKMRAEGEDVISLSLGEPDFPTPSHICEAAKQALDRGETHYSPSPGIPALREAIAQKLREENNLEVEASNIIVTPGAKQAIFEALLSTLDEGDEAVLFNPSWVSYEPAIRLAGAKVVWASTDENFRPSNLAEFVSHRTRILVANSPCNPTGAVFTRDNLREIADLSQDFDFLVLSDEIYEKIIYDQKHWSIGSFPGMEERTITINGFSKSYAMTGWRLGYAAAPPEVYRQMLKIHSHSVSQAATFVQHAGIAALQGSQQPVQEMREEFQARRDFLHQKLQELGIRAPLPQGAFYIFADVSEYGNGEEVAELLLKKAKVAVTPGIAFGSSGKNYIRISYAASMERLAEAVARMKEAL